ncbi:MAG: CTP synthase [Patescibacteria group bacterium]|nr:CTP synthase [Patescibacteria group bacterium]
MIKKARKYIFVVGGVLSGVGKGITTSSIAKILQSRGFKVTCAKIDPYINVDAGTMNPTEHGEVFVLDDGYETDQDMGNYERFLDVTLPSINYITTGRVYQSVIDKERALKYKGKCVEVVPHIPLEVIERLEKATRKAGAEITVVEVGGTVGEYQNILFLEAARMMKINNPGDVAFVMVGFLPVPSKLGEMKTKPTQYAVRTLNSAGIQPDIIVARSGYPLDKKRKEKLSTFCNVRTEDIISAPDLDSIYDIPVNFIRDKLDQRLLSTLDLKSRKTNLQDWRTFGRKVKAKKRPVNIAIVGKYFDSGDFVLSDAYISVIEALKYSAYAQNREPVLTWLNSKNFEDDKKVLDTLKEYDGILVPGGFGSSGVEGKMKVIKYARENKIPYLGLCYGMQLAVLEFARNVVGLRSASTREIDTKAKHLVIDVMADQEEALDGDNYGGTMRLGAYPCVLKRGSIAHQAYDRNRVKERHRHRYEVNEEYVERLEEAGLIFSGKSPDGSLMEIMELPLSEHPFFVGTQFHPEFLAHPLNPHPLFTAFIKAAKKRGSK